MVNKHDPRDPVDAHRQLSKSSPRVELGWNFKSFYDDMERMCEDIGFGQLGSRKETKFNDETTSLRQIKGQKTIWHI